MSDSPRIPGHPSDMNSSRSSEASSNTSSSHYNTNTPSPYPPAPSHSSSNNQVRNIIFGAIATVFTSTLIYYLTVYQNRNKSDSDNRLEVKEATIEAWKSYKAYENAYTSNLLSFEKTATESGSFDGYITGFNKESKKFTTDLTDLSETKNIDKDLVKAFNRRLDNEKTALEKANEYYKRIQQLSKNTGNLKKLKEDFVAEQIRWNQFYKGAYERSTTDIQEIAKILSERYGQSFSMTDFLIIQLMPQRMKTNDSIIHMLQQIDIDSNGNIVQENFAVDLRAKDVEGNWNVDGDVVSLQKNGVLNWTLTEGKKAIGTWKIIDEKIKIEATIGRSDEKINQTYRVSNLTPSSFTITQTESPFSQYNATRIVIN